MSLWLCMAFPRLALEASGDADAARVVYARQGARRWVIASSHAQIAAGEALASVQARFPDVPAQSRDPAAEAAALEALGCLAWRLGDRVTLSNEPPRGVYDTPFQAVSVDIGPSLKLFGGLDRALAKARELLATLPHAARLGVAPTPAAAAVFARLGLPPLAEGETLRERLSLLPLHAFRWPTASVDLLAGSGHQTLADLLRHDTASLAMRLGLGFVQTLDRLLGRAADPRPAFVPPPRYRRRWDMDAEIDDWQALLFPLRRLFDEFEGYLRARQMAATELNVTLARRRTEGERFVLRSTTPTQSAELLLRLLRERWNAQPPQAACNELRLHADRFVDLVSPQTPLFEDGNAGGEAWNALADRLRARLGEEALWRPGLADDHRPERAWQRDGAAASNASPPPRPLWLLRQPRSVPPPATLASEPEVISTGWWDQAPVQREYHFMRSGEGERQWVYRDRVDGAWYVQGLD